MGSETTFLLVVSAMLVVDAAVAGSMWLESRSPYHRSLFFVWVFGIASLVAQGLVSSPRWNIIAFGVSVFVMNLMLADAIRRVLDLRVPWKAHLGLFALAFGVSQVASTAALPFRAQALPMAIGAALPLLDLLSRTFRGAWRTRSIMVKGTLLAAALFAAHNINYGLMRYHADTMAIGAVLAGFVPSILAVFALSICTPAVLIERTANENARLAKTAQGALASRERFLRVSSRELSTPLASLEHTVQELGASSSTSRSSLLELADRQTETMTRLVDKMLAEVKPPGPVVE